MKKILFSILSLGVVAVVAIGATRAYFSSTEEILGNNIETAFLEITWDENRSQWGNSLYFPINDIAPGETTSWIDTNGTAHDQRVRLLITDGSLIPDHYELQFSTTNFVDGFDEGYGSVSTRNQFTKQMILTNLVAYTDGWSWNGLMGKVQDIDGDGILSLYDLERQVIDDIPVGPNLSVIAFEFKMSEDAGNKFQRDSIELVITVGAAQVAGQSVL
jgi:predicted ribosomally synthesized peptide with SipW-like signal peptide